MEYITCNEMKKLEKDADKAGLLFYKMMENAGMKTTEVILRECGSRGICGGSKAAVFCGKGNNGGDGFVVARLLRQKGYKVTVILAEGSPVTTDAITNHNLLKDITILDRIPENMEAAVVVDAMYGTGFRGELRHNGKAAVKLINRMHENGSLVFAVDIPSGFLVQADFTVTFHAPKDVLKQAAHTGQLIVADIGITAALETSYLNSKSGYTIPYRHNICGNEKKVCIILHGFGSSMESITAKLLSENLPKYGVATIAFDLPAHGSSMVDGNFLTVDHCIEDLSSIEEHIKRLNPTADIVYFGSSFGAYITLLYIAKGNVSGKKAFLRSAAVTMSDFFNNLPSDEATELMKNGYFVMGEKYGYEKDIEITSTFVNELRSNNLFEIWNGRKSFPASMEIMMIHGKEDEVIDYNAAYEFSKINKIRLCTVDGGDHRLSKGNMPDKMLQAAIKFIDGQNTTCHQL